MEQFSGKGNHLKVHELSLAQGLLNQLLQIANEHGAERICRATVSMGRDSCVVKDSFIFGFNAIKTEFPITNRTRLEIIDTEGTDLVLMQVEME